MAQKQQQALLNALKLELKFCERGGYKPSVPGRLPARASENDPISMFLFHESTRGSRKERSVFQDSPSCLNYGLPVREHPCSECWLIDFVPAEKRGAAVPCHHIPLNERGDTVATLGGSGDAPDVQEAVLDWLRRTIQQLEGAHNRNSQRREGSLRRGGSRVPLGKEDARASSCPYVSTVPWTTPDLTASRHTVRQTKRAQ